MTTNLSSSIIEKFNGYKYLKPKLARKEKIDVTAIDIVYEPVYDENVPVPCFFYKSNLPSLQKLFWRI